MALSEAEHAEYVTVGTNRGMSQAELEPYLRPAGRKITDVYDGDRRDSERKCQRLHADSDNSPLDAEFSRAPLKSRPDRCRTLRLEHVGNGDRLGGRVFCALVAARNH